MLEIVQDLYEAIKLIKPSYVCGPNPSDINKFYKAYKNYMRGPLDPINIFETCTLMWLIIFSLCIIY